eukprot:gene5021-7009_t
MSGNNTTANNPNTNAKRTAGLSGWKGIAVGMAIVLVPWAFYANFHPKLSASSGNNAISSTATLSGLDSAHLLGQLSQLTTKEIIQIKQNFSSTADRDKQLIDEQTNAISGRKKPMDSSNNKISLKEEANQIKAKNTILKPDMKVNDITNNLNNNHGLKYVRKGEPHKVDKIDKIEKKTSIIEKEAEEVPIQTKAPKLDKLEESSIDEELSEGKAKKKKNKRKKASAQPIPDVERLPEPRFNKDKNSFELADMPILGPVPTDGAKPLFDVKHQGQDAIFALACNYPKIYYQRFVGSLRKFGYEGDIVLAVSPVAKMKPGVADYLKKTGVVAYGFDVDCAGPDNCKFQDEFLGYPDPRPFRTFANIRYALYEYWLRQYNDKSYILILDFRDTFFQGDPFSSFGQFNSRKPKYELHLFAENYKVKNIGICVYNSMWVGRCFGKPALDKLSHEAVICSGSTLGSYAAIFYYVRTMLHSMDTVKCWLKGIESDQGYQNYLFYNGYFNTTVGDAILFHQGNGVVNTIGAMNGFRVPKDKKGPLDKFWKVRDKDGFLINYDGTRSACVHQWDRWYDELQKFIDHNLF